LAFSIILTIARIFLQFRNLANAFSTMTQPGDDDPNSALLDQLVEQLMASAEHPPSQVDGVSDEFLEQLERVPKKNLQAEQSCPICSNPFLDGMFGSCFSIIPLTGLFLGKYTYFFIMIRSSPARCATIVSSRSYFRPGMYNALVETQPNLSAVRTIFTLFPETKEKQQIQFSIADKYFDNSDRQKLIKEKPFIPPPADDDEDEYDDMYA
jgi:hypothetical protein